MMERTQFLGPSVVGLAVLAPPHLVRFLEAQPPVGSCLYWLTAWLVTGL